MPVTVLNGAPERAALDVENTRSSSSAKDRSNVTTAGGRDCDSSETKTCFIRVQVWKIKNTSGEMEWLSGERDLDR